MYDALKKYKTGKVVEREATICNGSGKNQTVFITSEELEFPLGDMIVELMEMKKKPWWRRNWDHDTVVKYFVEHLNKIVVKGWW